MPRTSIGLDPELSAYLHAVTVRETDALARLRRATAERDDAFMQIAPEQGQAMALFLRLMGARRVIEIGTFTGYSALWMAHALPPDGELITCDREADRESVARPYWEADGLGERIAFRAGDGLAVLDALHTERGGESFDAVFIDADKESYAAYHEKALALIRPGGLIMLDNTLWSGEVTAESPTSAATRALQAINLSVAQDDRVDQALTPIGDGLTLIRKR